MKCHKNLIRPSAMLCSILMIISVFTSCRQNVQPSHSDESSSAATDTTGSAEPVSPTQQGEFNIGTNTTTTIKTGLLTKTTNNSDNRNSDLTTTKKQTTTNAEANDNYKNTAAYAFDGNPETYWVAESSGKSVLTHKFSKATSFNVIRFKEEGVKIDEIIVEIKDSKGNYVVVYRQDEVGRRTGVLDETYTTTEVRVTIDSKLIPTIQDITFENVTQKRSTPFRVVSYVNTNMTDNRKNYDKLDIVTDLIMIGYTTFNDKGDLLFNLSSRESMQANLAELRENIGKRKIDVWFSIGSFSSDSNKSKLFADSSSRKKLVETCVELAKTHGFTGIDVDYEYPQDETAWKNYSLFLEELSAALKKEGKKLSAALSPWGVKLSKNAISGIDYVNIMAYDLGDTKKRHSSYKLINTSFDYFVNLGFKPSQLVMGLAFYGVSVNSLSDPESGKPYYYYVQRFRSAVKTYVNQVGDIYFTGRDMNRDKTLMAIESGLSGVFSWHFGCDIPYSDERSLFRGVEDAVKRFVQ